MVWWALVRCRILRILNMHLRLFKNLSLLITCFMSLFYRWTSIWYHEFINIIIADYNQSFYVCSKPLLPVKSINLMSFSWTLTPSGTVPYPTASWQQYRSGKALTLWHLRCKSVVVFMNSSLFEASFTHLRVSVFLIVMKSLSIYFDDSILDHKDTTETRRSLHGQPLRLINKNA